MIVHAHAQAKSLFLAAFAFIAITGPITAGASVPYDPKPWIEDLDEARVAIGSKYANLEFVVTERELDLSALFADTRKRIELATSDMEAHAAIDRLAREFGDGHVRFKWPSKLASHLARHTDCAALGYDARMQGSPTAALIRGYMPLAATSTSDFPTGLIPLANDKIGVIKIGVFAPQGYPELCSAALSALHIEPTTRCDDTCSDKIEAWVSERMTQDLQAQLLAVKAAGANVLLVDLIDNGGGTQWAEVAARMLTGVHLRAARMGFVRGSHWADSFAKQESLLRSAAAEASDDDRKLLTVLADQVAKRRREATIACNSAPLWRGEKLPCQWLGEGFFATGLLDSASPRQLQGRLWAPLVFSPTNFRYEEGVWRGPLIVLINGGTGSAAAQFAAELQDNHAAIVMGTPSAAGGCGHTNGGTPTKLNHSGAVLELPDCVRFRADGSNEAMGVEPDVLVGLRDEDGPHRRAARIAQALPQVVKEAIGLIH